MGAKSFRQADRNDWWWVGGCRTSGASGVDNNPTSECFVQVIILVIYQNSNASGPVKKLFSHLGRKPVAKPRRTDLANLTRFLCCLDSFPRFWGSGRPLWRPKSKILSLKKFASKPLFGPSSGPAQF